MLKKALIHVTSRVALQAMPLVLCVAFLCPVFGQDAQLSQFYASPLVQNPAFAGSAYKPRAFMQYRSQWPGLGQPLTSFYASVDAYLRRAQSGIGLVVAQHKAMAGTYKATEVRAQYAYLSQLTKKVSLASGVQLGLQQRNLGYSQTVFGDQFDTSGRIVPSADPIAGNDLSFAVPDVGVGFLLFDASNYISITATHLNQPRLRYQSTEQTLPAWYGITGGHVFRFSQGRGLIPNGPDPELTLAFLYKQQAHYRQLDLGAYYNLQPLVIGVWYRGLPAVPSIPGVFNQESAVFLIGVKQDNLSIGYSYDINLSRIVPTYQGSHELSLSYAFKQPGPRHKKQRALPCPTF